MARCGRSRAAAALLVLGLGLVGFAAVAWADLRLGVSLEEGMTLMGGPLTYRMASTDGVTGASIDAVTSASRISHGGGLHLRLRRGEDLGALVLGVEYIHYRFDLDYTVSRAAVDIAGVRLLVLPRLVVLRLRGRPFFSFGMGAYLELAFYDRAELGGQAIGLEVDPAAAGLVIDLRLEYFRFELSRGRGRLVPALVLRGYRGLTTIFRDELGSSAPLASILIGLGLTYELPSQGNGRSGSGRQGE